MAPLTLITNIGELVAVPPGPVAGPQMSRLPVIADAALLVEGDRIAWFGPRSDAPTTGDRSLEIIDAHGGCVTPGLIDCHTHVVFAGSREREWVQKIEGRSYLEILQSGGGIHTTVAAVRAASEEALAAETLPRLRRMLAAGVTTVEIKSGYGLSAADELKMLRVIRRLAGRTPQELVGAYLAAHTVPTEFAGRPDDYLDEVARDDVLEMIRREQLAEFCDVFCERGAFTVEQSERFLRAGMRHGLRPKIHADQLSQMGASVLAGRLGAVSADHLEFIDDAGIAALQEAGCVAVLLPGCSLFLNSRPADARRLIGAGLAVALATDCNPGSCRIESLPLILSLGCALLRLTPKESLAACTANAAAAMRRQGRVGAIAAGHQADLAVFEASSIERVCYEMGRSAVRLVIKRGRVVWRGEGGESASPGQE